MTFPPAVSHGPSAMIRSKDSYRFPYTESELLADLTPEKAHADELAKPTLPEFGD